MLLYYNNTDIFVLYKKNTNIEFSKGIGTCAIRTPVGCDVYTNLLGCCEYALGCNRVGFQRRVPYL